MIKKYVKTTPIEAIQVTPDNHKELEEFASKQRITFGYELIMYSIDTLEGKMYFSDGDYLIKNQTGECYVCKKEIFEKKYSDYHPEIARHKTPQELEKEVEQLRAKVDKLEKCITDLKYIVASW